VSLESAPLICQVLSGGVCWCS